MSHDDSLASHQPAFGVPHVRMDGEAKVTGRACYASDEPVENAAYAFLLTSTIANGRVRRIHADDALSLDGVLDVLTHENVGSEAKPPEQQAGGATTSTLESDRVWHDGQIIGVVVATSYEFAREAAQRTRIDYDEAPASATFGSAGVAGERREPGEHEDYRIGDFERAFAGAECRVEAIYATPTQHHNPIELYTTTCAWQGDRLTIWEPSQFVYGLRGNVAQQLGISREQVHVISRFVGGAFGGKGNATARTAWIAIAARRGTAGEARGDTGPELHHRDVSRGDAPSCPVGRDARRQARCVAARRLGTHEPTQHVQRFGNRNNGARLRVSEYRNRGERRARRPQYARVHARAAGNAVHVRAGNGDG